MLDAMLPNITDDRAGEGAKGAGETVPRSTGTGEHAIVGHNALGGETARTANRERDAGVPADLQQRDRPLACLRGHLGPLLSALGRVPSGEGH
jgi:hypothetical protein